MQIKGQVIRGMGFSEIETRRAALGVEQKALCKRAGVHATTYSRLKLRPGELGASSRTLTKLKGALDALVAEKGAGNGNGHDGQSGN